jgi:Tfp pilus assembly pilus retraction ATPase PilT
METAEIALQAAQTGHLVLSTIHAGSAEETIKRFAGLYPADERPNVKRTLATTIQGIIAQRLVVDVENNKFPVMEVMVNTHRITQALLADAEGETAENITRIIADSELQGMNTLDQYLIKMFIKGRISLDTAFREANEPLVMKQELHRKGYQIR